MSQSARHALILVSALALMAACDRHQAESGGEASQHVTTSDKVNAQGSVEASAAQEDVNPYSPYGVRVRDNNHFDVVTFKDVGVGHFTANREPLLEAIADSLAFNMSIDPTMPYSASLVHDEQFADPDSHVYCAMNHIYVDVWTSTDPDRFGYSLWSGCSETDQFAWEELPIEVKDGSDYFTAVEVLTGRIADRIRDADSRDCFTQTC